jgi:hypothetical protein
VIDEKDFVITNWTAKYNQAVAYYTTLEREKVVATNLLKTKDELIKGLEGSLKSTRFVGNLTKTTTVIAVAAGMAAFFLIKK